MAKKYDMRLNIYLDESEPKDKIIIDFLKKKYSEVGFIKETLYALATGEVVHNGVSVQSITNGSMNEPINESLVTNDEPEETYEDIKGIGDIEI